MQIAFNLTILSCVYLPTFYLFKAVFFGLWVGLLLRRILGHLYGQLRERSRTITEVLGPRRPPLLLRAALPAHPDPPRRQLLLDDLLLHRAIEEVSGAREALSSEVTFRSTDASEPDQIPAAAQVLARRSIGRRRRVAAYGRRARHGAEASSCWRRVVTMAGGPASSSTLDNGRGFHAKTTATSSSDERVLDAFHRGGDGPPQLRRPRPPPSSLSDSSSQRRPPRCGLGRLDVLTRLAADCRARTTRIAAYLPAPLERGRVVGVRAPSAASPAKLSDSRSSRACWDPEKGVWFVSQCLTTSGGDDGLQSAAREADASRDRGRGGLQNGQAERLPPLLERAPRRRHELVSAMGALAPRDRSRRS